MTTVKGSDEARSGAGVVTLSASAAGIAEAARLLTHGGIVGIPTETVYGLAASVFDEVAIGRIYEAKGRPRGNPLIVHVSREMVAGGVVAGLDGLGLIRAAALNEEQVVAIQRLVATFWPGPLTLVVPRGERVPHAATGGGESVAVRMPDHPVTARLIAAAGVPLVAPSANRFGRISPTTARQVVEELGGRVDAVLDGGACNVGVESTVVRVERDGSVTVLRDGGLSREALGQRVTVNRRGVLHAKAGVTLESPGQLASHYAPVAKVVMWEGVVGREGFHGRLLGATREGLRALRVAVLAMDEAGAGEVTSALETSEACSAVVAVATLCRSRGNAHTDRDAAARLFTLLRELDGLQPDVIAVELPGEEMAGLWRAIRDRLMRAAA